MGEEYRPSIFRRLLALIIDFIILGIIGYISGLFLEDFYVSLGNYGTLIGTAIAIIYFSIFQSSLGKGQTLGKRIIQAKVTDIKGEYLSLEKSFLRSFIVFFPIMNLDLFASSNVMLIIGMLLTLMNLATFYFVLINSSRRCLHDILVSSVVSHQSVTDFDIDEQYDRSKKKLIPIGIISALLIVTAGYNTLARNTFSQFLAAKGKIEQIDGVIAVNEIKASTLTYFGKKKHSETRSSFLVSVRIDDIKDASYSESKYFDDIYKIIQSEIPESQEMGNVNITLNNGYNIGIAKKDHFISRTIK